MYYDLPLIHDKTPTSGKSLQHDFLLCFPSYWLVFVLKEHKRSVYLEAESCFCILDIFNKGGWIMPLTEATNWFFWLAAAYLSIRAPLEEKVLNALSCSEETSKHFTCCRDYSPFSWVSALRYMIGRPVFSKFSAWAAEPRLMSRTACPGFSPVTSMFAASQLVYPHPCHWHRSRYYITHIKESCTGNHHP